MNRWRSPGLRTQRADIRSRVEQLLADAEKGGEDRVRALARVKRR
jgi:hypothetical protein